MPLELNEVLQAIKGLNLNDLNILTIALDNLKTAQVVKSKEKTLIEHDYPKLSIPLEFTGPFVENLFIALIKNITLKHKYDYSFNCKEEVTNDLSVIIKSYYDDTEMKDGQYPKVAVKCGSMSLSNTSMADLAPEGVNSTNTQKISRKHCWSDFSLGIDVMAMSEQEADILATKYALGIAQQRDTLREVGNLYYVSYPQVSYAQQIRGYNNVFLSRINVSIKKEVSWDEIVDLETFSNFIVDLMAVCKIRSECKGFEQFLYVSFDQYGINAEAVDKRLNDLHNNREQGENC
jgi:hypothetical protein